MYIPLYSLSHSLLSLFCSTLCSTFNLSCALFFCFFYSSLYSFFSLSQYIFFTVSHSALLFFPCFSSFVLFLVFSFSCSIFLSVSLAINNLTLIHSDFVFSFVLDFFPSLISSDFALFSLLFGITFLSFLAIFF